MNYKILLTIFLVLILVILLLRIPQKTNQVATVGFKNTKILAEVADEEPEQKIGLSGREELFEGQGMLFVYQDKEKRSFWMKDTKFPLDIIFIEDDKIVEITTLQIPDEKGIPKYQSQNKANFVLEVNAGFVLKNEIKVGDRVKISLE